MPTGRVRASFAESSVDLPSRSLQRNLPTETRKQSHPAHLPHLANGQSRAVLQIQLHGLVGSEEPGERLEVTTKQTQVSGCSAHKRLLFRSCKPRKAGWGQPARAEPFETRAARCANDSEALPTHGVRKKTPPSSNARGAKMVLPHRSAC